MGFGSQSAASYQAPSQLRSPSHPESTAAPQKPSILTPRPRTRRVSNLRDDTTSEMLRFDTQHRPPSRELDFRPPRMFGQQAPTSSVRSSMYGQIAPSREGGRPMGYTTPPGNLDFSPLTPPVASASSERARVSGPGPKEGHTTGTQAPALSSTTGPLSDVPSDEVASEEFVRRPPKSSYAGTIAASEILPPIPRRYTYQGDAPLPAGFEDHTRGEQLRRKAGPGYGGHGGHSGRGGRGGRGGPGGAAPRG